jgi:hypothetical protein
MTNSKVDVIKRAVEFYRDSGNVLLADILETELREELRHIPACWWTFEGEEEEEVN